MSWWVVAFGVSSLLTPRDPASNRMPRRRELLYGGLSAATLGSFATALAMLDTRTSSGMLDQLELYSDDRSTAIELQQLSSSNQLWPARRELEAQWRALRDHPADLAQTAEAYATVLRVRAAIALAEDLARDQRWADLDAALPLQLVREFEAACTVLSLSAALSADARAAIGFQWGACGWKRCGAQADGAQAICKLRQNLGMIVPIEALFYLDVAKRAVDEVLAAAASSSPALAALLREAPGGGSAAEYLDVETLDLLLATDDAEGGTEAEDAVAEWEREVLRQAGILSSESRSTDEDDASGEPLNGDAE